MRRIALKLVLFLLLGAILNVALAWGLALWSPVEEVGSPFLRISPIEGQPYIPTDWTRKHYEKSFISVGSTHQEGFGVWTQQIMVEEMLAGLDKFYGPDHAVHLHRAGWPLISTGCEGYLDWNMFSTRNGEAPAPQIWKWGVQVPPSLKPGTSPLFPFDYSNPLPLRPIWPGFAINTIFYAVIIWLLFSFPFTLRRTRRIKCGLCLKCGYDLRGSASQTCPECGTAVRT